MQIVDDYVNIIECINNGNSIFNIIIYYIVEDIDESLLPIAYEKIKEINKNKIEIESEEAKLNRILEDINMVYLLIY